jgi:NitT/TauT family transport system substrate-binding protein
MNWLGQLGIPTDGSEEGVTIQKINFNVDPLIQRQADCVTVMTYNEYWQIMDAGVTPEELTVFSYSDEGVATLEDGLYVLEENLEDPAFVDRMARFVRASMKGWAWAAENPEEAAQIVMDYDETGAQTIEHQTRMMNEIAKLITDQDPALDPAAYERTVQTLMAGGSDPVITQEPEGAWTHAVTDVALAQ